MTTCFVMQVFDEGGAYDKRYDQTFAPAISNGGAIPQRADKILGTKPVIEKIESAIRDATIAFAEITENNANVFIELGYALNLNVPLVMVCDKAKRAILPFDINQRPVIFYKTESQGDFEDLGKNIETAVGAALNEASARASTTVKQLSLDVGNADSDDLKDRILLEVLESEIGDPNGLTAYRLKSTLAAEGFSERITSLAALALKSDGLITSNTFEDRDGDSYLTYCLTDSGKDLLLGRYAEIKRTEETRQSIRQRMGRIPSFDSDLDDDVPF
jgi:hypothetical protein